MPGTNNSFNSGFSNGFAVESQSDGIPSHIDTQLVYKSQQTIFEKVIKCTVKQHELKYTYNPTTLINPSDPFSKINPIFINSEFTPFVTTIGLYNESNELVAIAKLEFPVKLPQHTDITFIIRIDF